MFLYILTKEYSELKPTDKRHIAAFVDFHKAERYMQNREEKEFFLKVKDEILPLAVYGRLHKGIFDKHPIVTKGGLIGDDTAISKCVDYLLIKLSNESYAKKN